jgi:hypothetical protein
VRGTVATSWRRMRDGFELDVTETLGGSAVAAGRAPSVTLVGVEGGRVGYDLGSGRYRFRVQAPRAD